MNERIESLMNEHPTLGLFVVIGLGIAFVGALIGIPILAEWLANEVIP